MLTRGDIYTALQRYAQRRTTDAEVPGQSGASLKLQQEFDELDFGARFIVTSNGNRYTRTDPRRYADGGRITQEANVGGAANAVQLQGRNLSSAAPTDGQVVGWNAGASQWQPISVTSTPLSDATPQAISGVGNPGTATAASRADHVHPVTGLAALAVANTFTQPQNVNVSDGFIYVTDVLSLTHTASGLNAGRGAAMTLVVNDQTLGRVIGQYNDEQSSIELRPNYRGGGLFATAFGFRCRANVANAEWGVEVLPDVAGGAPIVQPTNAGVGGINADMIVRGSGTGRLLLGRPVAPNGTVANILAGVGPFASPGPGMYAFATDATGGATMAFYTGAAWVMAVTTPLA